MFLCHEISLSQEKKYYHNEQQNVGKLVSITSKPIYF